MKKNLLVIMIALLVLAGTCDYSDNRLTVKNNSEQVITVDFSEDTLMEKRSNDNIVYFVRDKIEQGETMRKTMPGSENGWPFLVQRSKNNRLNIFFIEVDTLVKYNDWDYIKANRLYIRKEYTLEELEKGDWVIEYP